MGDADRLRIFIHAVLLVMIFAGTVVAIWPPMPTDPEPYVFDISTRWLVVLVLLFVVGVVAAWRYWLGNHPKSEVRHYAPHGVLYEYRDGGFVREEL